jgi:glucose/arabinose dehydrogenase
MISFFRVGLFSTFPASTLIVGLACSDSKEATPPLNIEGLKVETVVTGLVTPWDLEWGPDGQLWVSERGGRISRVNPSTGQRSTAGQVPQVSESGEAGLMGLAFHPDFTTQPYVYAAHSYLQNGALRNRLVRMRWDGQSLGAPDVLLSNIPASSIHDGSRLAIGPDRLLYMTMGDASNGDLAQDRTALAGKILRLTLTGQPAPGNPFGTAIYSFGHRNPQGLVFHPTTAALYSTEHGPSDNDEVNLIIAGRNYGWPTVHGTCDDDIGNERTFCQANDVVEPLAMWTPTIAPSGADLYLADLIPQWKGSLLFTSLKGTALYRLTLSSDGQRVTAKETLFAGQYGRLRDVLVAPDGSVYLATSNRDGRGSPAADDDRILRVRPQ